MQEVTLFEAVDMRHNSQVEALSDKLSLAMELLSCAAIPGGRPLPGRVRTLRGGISAAMPRRPLPCPGRTTGERPGQWRPWHSMTLRLEVQQGVSYGRFGSAYADHHHQKAADTVVYRLKKEGMVAIGVRDIQQRPGCISWVIRRISPATAGADVAAGVERAFLGEEVGRRGAAECDRRGGRPGESGAAAPGRQRF